MNFVWSEYILLAEDLLNSQKNNEQSYLRAATSRAYYGAFCIARDIKGYTNFIESDVHQRVLNEYKFSGFKKQKDVWQKLDELRRLRNIADYNGSAQFKKRDVEKSIIKAREILSLLDYK